MERHAARLFGRGGRPSGLLKFPQRLGAETAKRIGYWTEFWKEGLVASLTIHKQKEFMAWLKAKGYSNSYASRTMSVSRAAIRMAWKHGEITSASFILDEPDRSDAKERYRLDKEEMKALLTEVQEWPHLYAYVTPQSPAPVSQAGASRSTGRSVSAGEGAAALRGRRPVCDGIAVRPRPSCGSAWRAAELRARLPSACGRGPSAWRATTA